MLEAREDFLHLMIGHGIPEAEVISMTDEEFQMTLNAILDENSPRAQQRQTYGHPQIRGPRPNNQEYRGVTLPDGFGNGNYNEDEAVRMAIENSLDDMLIAPHLRQPPPPQDEVGFHPRPSSNIHSHLNTNYNYNYNRNETHNYPPRPNPKPTPLPSSKTPRTNEAPKYNKDRSPSCSRPRRPAAPPPTSQYTSQTKKKSTTTTSSGKTSNPQTKSRPTTTSTTAAPSAINHNLVVTNSKPKINSNAPIAGTVNRKSPRQTGSSKSTASGGSSGTRPSAGTRKTTTTASTTTRTSATRPSNAPATRTSTNRPSNTPATRTGTKNAPSNPTSSHSSRATGETIVNSRPSTNQTPRSQHKQNPTVKTDNIHNIQQKHTKKTDDTDNYQYKPKLRPNPTFINEAILDPTPDILHPKHYDNDDDSLLDDRLNYEKYYLKPKATNSNYKLPNPSPSQANPKPQPQLQPQPKPKPKTEEKPPEAKFSESQILRNIQDMEFIQATQEAERKEREEAEKKAQEERKAQEEKAKKESRLDEAVRLFKSIPPEPANGEKVVTIAAQVPNLNRIMRKFPPSSKGLDVYAWVSGQTLELDDEDKLFVDSFDLMQAGGQAQALDKDSTLEEQKISGRVLFQAVLV